MRFSKSENYVWIFLAFFELWTVVRAVLSSVVKNPKKKLCLVFIYIFINGENIRGSISESLKCVYQNVIFLGFNLISWSCGGIFLVCQKHVRYYWDMALVSQYIPS